jgi:hypothetical protein
MNVRSDITAEGDSLAVAVHWQSNQTGMPDAGDSVRVEVGLGDGRESRIHVTPGNQESDTLRLKAPAVGETAAGYSCVALVRGARLSRETCTPWQYVRPAAQVPTTPAKPTTPSRDSAAKGAEKAAKKAATPGAASIARIVVEPSGQQVDPDVGGKCAAYQRKNPGRRVWVDVNREAIPECTGPNGKPTVAQFCAFAVLKDGRRVKTENSANDPYCDRLFQMWSRERVT